PTFLSQRRVALRDLHAFPTRRSSDLGVGQATLYRRFPRREDLIAACFAPALAEYATAVAEALAAPDPWEGFRGFVAHACAMQAADRKSTRLNSSHVKISYAVFCLKKK